LAEIAISEEILQETLGIMRHKFKLPEERVAQARQYIEALPRQRFGRGERSVWTPPS
jgi:hypothetical protein